MANHKSALKRHRQSLKRRDRNRGVKSRLRTLIRRVHEAIDAGDKQAAQAGLREASQALAKAASKGVLHSNNASRRSGRLARAVAAVGD